MHIKTVSTSALRVTGLDVLRSLAIILVIIYHYSVFVSHNNNFGFISNIGWIGVDLFFVLSGYLISNQIFKALQLEKFSLAKFYIKRIFKTLPNYYFVLALYFIVPSFAEKPIALPFWEYLIFVQNFNLPVSGFSQSWSLCVEEQFYLLFPFLALWLYRKNKNSLMAILILTMLCGLFLRGILWQHLDISNNLKQFTRIIYYPTYCRLDGFICGIFVAIIQNHYCKFWGRITNYSNILLAIGGLLLTCFIFIVTKRDSFLSATIGFPGISISFAIITLAALTDKSLLSKYNLPFCNRLALWSYAIYLLQKPISVLCAKYFSSIGLSNNAYSVICINFLIQVLAGYTMFYLWESKFMLIRNKVLTYLN